MRTDFLFEALENEIEHIDRMRAERLEAEQTWQRMVETLNRVGTGFVFDADKYEDDALQLIIDLDHCRTLTLGDFTEQMYRTPQGKRVIDRIDDLSLIYNVSAF